MNSKRRGNRAGFEYLSGPASKSWECLLAADRCLRIRQMKPSMSPYVYPAKTTPNRIHDASNFGVHLYLPCCSAIDASPPAIDRVLNSLAQLAGLHKTPVAEELPRRNGPLKFSTFSNRARPFPDVSLANTPILRPGIQIMLRESCEWQRETAVPFVGGSRFGWWDCWRGIGARLFLSNCRLLYWLISLGHRRMCNSRVT